MSSKVHPEMLGRSRRRIQVQSRTGASTHSLIKGIRVACLLLALLPPLKADDPMEMGPFPTRDMFPLFLVPMVYQPVDPTPLGSGVWRVSIDHIRANTFEFSDVLKNKAPRDNQGRVAITRAFVLDHASEFANLPLVFYFDEEVVRTSLRLRFGLTPRTDFWGEIPFQSHTGGYLDGLIEDFHHLGFEQSGRELVQRNQLTLVVLTRGQLRFYSDRPIRGKTQDPTLGVTHLLSEGSTWLLSGYMALKPSLTTTYDIYRSGWDQAYGLTARWQPGPRWVFYGGAAFIHRPGGNGAFNYSDFGGFRDGWGCHGTFEFRGWPRLRPFFQLYAQSGQLPYHPSQKLDRPSLQHDIGFHWSIRKNTVLTFRYLNNITHNENTADMGLGLSLTTTFR